MSGELTVASKLPVAREKSDSIGDLVGAFESDTRAIFLRTSPVNEHITLYVLSAMLVLAVVMTAIVKVDRVVTSVTGIIVPTAG